MGNKEALICGVLMFTLIMIAFLVPTYMNYNSKVQECCIGFRLYVLDGQSGGECHAWTFKDHLSGLRGCVVEDLNNPWEDDS